LARCGKGTGNCLFPALPTTFYFLIKREDLTMSKKLISILFVLILGMTGCAGPKHFGVEDKALILPPDVAQTEDAIAKSEKSAGAKYCPDKIAKARALAKEAMDVYWSCQTTKAMGMLADARKMAKEAESCGPVASAAPAPVAPAPMPVPAPPIVRQPISFHTVTFDFDKSDLKPAARAELDRAAKVMAENPDVVLELQGNTDSVGTDKYNMALGNRRAEAVFKYLNAKGIKSDRLKEHSFGEGKPAATNDTDAGRTLNRRVDLVILK
jgi:outer membrane protein OmpA-like peptidoglycan-associated protein